MYTHEVHRHTITTHIRRINMVLYHGTSEGNANKIIIEGFKVGTYFTWDLHSALVMGGQYVFGIWMDINRDSYWEYITPDPISIDKILYMRRFDVECLYDNHVAITNMRRLTIEDTYRANHLLEPDDPTDDASQLRSLQDHECANTEFCESCNGKGQMNEPRRYAWQEPTGCMVCEVCHGFGYLERDNV